MAFFSKVFSGQPNWTWSGCLNWCFRNQSSQDHAEIPGDNYDQKLVTSSPDEEVSEYSITDHTPTKGKGDRSGENGESGFYFYTQSLNFKALFPLYLHQLTM